MRTDRAFKLVKKLARGELGELRDRAREELYRREERRRYTEGWSPLTPERLAGIFNLQFLDEFRTPSGEIDFVAALRSHAELALVPGFSRTADFSEHVKTVCPGEAERVVAAADQICSDRFPVFNLGFISYGDPPRWGLDPLLNVASPDCFYGDINYLDPTVVGDSKVVWEISRFQFVYDLGQAYILTSDEKYARKFFDLLSNWRLTNRDYHGINFCSALESAFRIHSLIWGIHFFKSSQSLTNDIALNIFSLLQTCADFVSRHLSRHFAPNTHLLGEAYALFMAGMLFPGFRQAGSWRKRGHDTFLSELTNQFTADGMHAELSTAYHGYAVEFLLSVVSVCRQYGVQVKSLFEERLRQSVGVLVALQRPDRTWPHVGDEDGGRLFFLSRVPASDFRPLLESCRTYLGDQPDASPLHYVDSFWFSYPQPPAAGKPTPRRESSVLARSGLIVSRSSTGMFSALQCGQFGYLDSPHSHADMLHLDISVGEDNFLVDPGTFVYTADLPRRNVYRSASVHNGPMPEGLQLESPCDPFAWLDKPDCRLTARLQTPRSEFYSADCVMKAGGCRTVVSRSVLFLHDTCWVICDAADSETLPTLSWNFVTPLPAVFNEGVLVFDGVSTRLALITGLPDLTERDIVIQPFAVSEDYLSAKPGSRITVTAPSVSGAAAFFVVLPLHKDAGRVSSIDNRRWGKGLTSRFSLGNTEILVSTGLTGGDIQSDAELALAILVERRLSRAIVVNGRYLAYHGRDLVRTKDTVEFVDIYSKDSAYYADTIGTTEVLTPLPGKLT